MTKVTLGGSTYQEPRGLYERRDEVPEPAEVDNRRWYHWVLAGLLGGLLIGVPAMWIFGREHPARVVWVFAAIAAFWVLLVILA